jgi:hypothetical protein
MFDPASDYEGDYADFASAFANGAEWALAGVAVCEFLSDLAVLVNACPDCHGGVSVVPWDSCTYMACDTCNGTGKRVTP